jgi:hypothetical protein
MIPFHVWMMELTIMTLVVYTPGVMEEQRPFDGWNAHRKQCGQARHAGHSAGNMGEQRELARGASCDDVKGV